MSFVYTISQKTTLSVILLKNLPYFRKSFQWHFRITFHKDVLLARQGIREGTRDEARRTAMWKANFLRDSVYCYWTLQICIQLYMYKFYSHSFRGGTKIYPLEYEHLSDMCDPSLQRSTRCFVTENAPKSQFVSGVEAIQYSLHIALVATFQFFFSVSLNSPLEFLSSEIHRSEVTIRQKMLWNE